MNSNTVEKYRQYLEGLSSEELLGEKYVADLRQRHIESRLAAYESDLKTRPLAELILNYEELRQQAIQDELENEEDRLGRLDDHELVTAEALAEMRQRVIEAKVAEYERFLGRRQ
jgi:hypothetical protein